MSKVEKYDIKFDSDLEIKYYEYLMDNVNVFAFIYHPKPPIDLSIGNTYTPDFIVFYLDRIEIIETKGYNQFSFQRDNLIHNLMKQKSEDELKCYVKQCLQNDKNKSVIKQDYTFENSKYIYRKIKYLKTYGFVDFDFKNPNTLSNQRKQKVLELEKENKELKQEIKDLKRYIDYTNKSKLTSKQQEWLDEYRRRNM